MTSGRIALESLKGVGPRLKEKLARLDIASVEDLLFHLPSRYQDRTTVQAIGSVRPGAEVVVEGRIASCQVAFGRRRSLLTEIRDPSGALTMRLFHFSQSQKRALEQGTWARCFGEARRGPRALEMIHPEYTVFDAEPPALEPGGLTPVYPTTEGLGQNPLRRLVDQALALADEIAEELLPEEILRSNRFPALADALRQLHHPVSVPDAAGILAREHPARLRLAFEELLAHHLAAWQSRRRRTRLAAERIAVPGALWHRLESRLGFVPTGAQRRAIAEIREDLARGAPAHRLVQGDVGSGKTLVCAAACLDAIESGCQAAVMAPTEILAEQHVAAFMNWLQPLGIHVVALSGRQGARERRAALESIRTGVAQLVVGTHALFQEGVEFSRLALIVVDEQHRFGVMQRFALREKGRRQGTVPHQVTMTATPIPRSLAMTLYAEMDVTTIDELPPGRTPVQTVVLPESRRDEVLERIRSVCARGEQVYWVCPAIEESEVLEVQAATDTASALAGALDTLSVGLVHGRMKSAEKEAVMQRFRRGEIDLLVATTVIEVGVDVPNASLMVIENAERLGLAQLHQLRGRVGRGARRSYCVLLYRQPLGELARARLSVMRQSTDGFEIARRDLELRGPGEILGVRQSGLTRMVVADLMLDQPLLPMVRRTAEVLVRDHPERARRIMHRWVRSKMELADV